MQGEMYDKKKLLMIVGGFVVLVAIVLAVTLISILPRLGKVETYVGYAPFIAEVSLDGEMVKNNAKSYLEPGEYDLRVVLDGFETLEKKVTVSDENNSLFGSIVANTDEGIKLANAHLDDYAAVQSLFGMEISARGERNRKEWPIIQKLPITNSLYKIGYIIEDGEIKLSLAAYAANANVAVKKLKEAATATMDNLAEYNIEFKNFRNDYKGSFEENTMTSPEASLIYGFAGVTDLAVVNGVQNGDYYYAKVTTGSAETYTLVERKVVLKKVGEKWEIVSEVSPILTEYNSDNVPLEILKLANDLE